MRLSSQVLKGIIVHSKLLKISLILCFSFFFTGVYAGECFVLYKAKKNNPLKLHLGLMQVNEPCSGNSLEIVVSNRLKPSGWLLLKIVNTTESIETEKMKSDLGDYFLKY